MDSVKIELLLSSVGFRGSDLDSLSPPFETEYDTRIGLKWYPSATGPDTWTIVLTAVGIPSALFAKKFAELLATDIYNWAKDSLKRFFANKPHNSGMLELKLDDVHLYSLTPLEVLTSSDLVPILQGTDLTLAKEWEILVDPSSGKITLRPVAEKK
ncbi:hypothetical protein JAO85_03410 [Comamonas sp. NyZ500]|uniref:hypothetical protein n=1 Tax=Comamonas sp. NyZ500 TaxID=2795732 RepID=UPI00192CC990|nr:hypothetical protein [Comamonas sp. NyZ500]MBL5976310.1 hypothetical protein [Comamonas sp. NyZ500]